MASERYLHDNDFYGHLFYSEINQQKITLETEWVTGQTKFIEKINVKIVCLFECIFISLNKLIQNFS